VTLFTAMAGTCKRDEIAGMITEMDRWRELKLEVKGCLEPAPGFAILSYIVNAAHKNNEPDAAAVTSGYVKRNGAWKMVLHQQTPPCDQQVGQGERRTKEIARLLSPHLSMGVLRASPVPPLWPCYHKPQANGEFDRSMRPVTGGTVLRRDQGAKSTCHIRLSATRRITPHPSSGASSSRCFARERNCDAVCIARDTMLASAAAGATDYGPDAAQIEARLGNRCAQTLGCRRFCALAVGPWPWWLNHAADLSARFQGASVLPLPAKEVRAAEGRPLACVAGNVTVHRWLCCCSSPPAGCFCGMHASRHRQRCKPAACRTNLFGRRRVKSTSRRCVANA
jgi:hypothetical protein